MADDIIQGTDAAFEQDVLKSELPVLVDFWAPWCGPCRIIAPIVEEIAQAHTGKVRIVKINVDENQKTSARYGIMGIPTLILFKGGDVKETIVGVVPRTRIEEVIAKHL